jgi:hypothetical protein
MEGSYEHRKEPSGSKNVGGNSCVPAQLAAFQGGLSSMEIVSCFWKHEIRCKSTYGGSFIRNVTTVQLVARKRFPNLTKIKCSNRY